MEIATRAENLATGARALGLELRPEQLAQFWRYYQELLLWNQRMNLTAIVDWEAVQLKHFLDSLTVVSLLGKQPELCSAIDVGSGAGLPGLALKIALPHLRITLLESVAKKAAFISHVVRILELEGVAVVVGRAEERAQEPAYREQFDVALSRGLAPLPILVELTLPFCRIGGQAIAFKKVGVEAELNKSARGIGILGGGEPWVHKLDLDDLRDHLLVVTPKVSPTPAGYPRRSGMPAKRPL